MTGFVTGAGILPSGSPAGVGANLFPGLMHGADWLPTLSTVAGYSLSGTLPLDGVDQWQLITGATPLGTAGVGRTTLVIGNSTNMCSWPTSDNRYHGHATLANAGADLPAGAVAPGVGCGFATRMNVGSNKWKLIRGYGGGPDTWCNSTGAAGTAGTTGSAECAPNGPTLDAADAAATAAGTDNGGTCVTKAGTCLPYGTNTKVIDNATADACCAACVAENGCEFWVLNAKRCYLKGPGKPTKYRRDPACVSGTTTGSFPPAPPAPPAPPSKPLVECPNGYCLYDVEADPYEQHEISAAHPDIVAQMKAAMDTTLQSYHQYEEDASCPPHTFGNDSHVGQTWVPWC